MLKSDKDKFYQHLHWDLKINIITSLDSNLETLIRSLASINDGLPSAKPTTAGEWANIYSDIHAVDCFQLSRGWILRYRMTNQWWIYYVECPVTVMGA